MVQAVPIAIAGALARKTYYFVPLALSDRRGSEATLVAPAYTPELGDQAICHRNVSYDGTEGVFISTRLLGDRFALAFEFFINVGHAFVDVIGVPEVFDQLAWGQALADVRGETSQDAWESRNLALGAERHRRRRSTASLSSTRRRRNNYLEAAFSDALAIYQLSLAVDFDYSELREREYPLLAPQALADRLRLVARLFPPNPGYEFAIRYRRRALKTVFATNGEQVQSNARGGSDDACDTKLQELWPEEPPRRQSSCGYGALRRVQDSSCLRWMSRCRLIRSCSTRLSRTRVFRCLSISGRTGAVLVARQLRRSRARRRIWPGRLWF